MRWEWTFDVQRGMRWMADESQIADWEERMKIAKWGDGMRKEAAA